jgi:RES domain-containing protein
MILYRITKRIHARDLTGRGAQLVGGRWNSIGNAMLYTASSQSLAQLELLAHSTILPDGMVMVTLQIPARLRIPIFRATDLPSGWDDVPPTRVSQAFGDEFLQQGRSLAIGAPSVIVPDEENILINPFHPRSNAIEILSIEDLSIDARLK